jgi:hypothetical protein
MNPVESMDELCNLFVKSFDDDDAKQKGLHAKVILTFNPDKSDADRWSLCVQMTDSMDFGVHSWVIARGRTPQESATNARDRMLEVSRLKNAQRP